jgi:hypothetical protein
MQWCCNYETTVLFLYLSIFSLLPFFKMKHRTNNKIGNTGIKPWAVLCLLVLYALGSLPMDAVHRMFHAHAPAVMHTVKAEKDPCHRSLYHRDKACDHKTHVSGLKKCPLCQLSFHADQWLSDVSPSQQHLATASLETCFVQRYVHSCALPGSSRAPPVCG